MRKAILDQNNIGSTSPIQGMVPLYDIMVEMRTNDINENYIEYL